MGSRASKPGIPVEVSDRNWWELSKVTPQNWVKFGRQNFTPLYTVAEIVNACSSSVPTFTFCGVKGRDFKLKMKHRKSCGDDIVMQLLQTRLRLYLKKNVHFMKNKTALNIYSAKDRTNQKIKLGASIDEKLFDEFKSVFSLNLKSGQRLLQDLRLIVYGNVKIPKDRNSCKTFKSQVLASFDLMKKGSYSAEWFDCDPPIPFELLKDSNYNAEMKFSINITLQWSAEPLLTQDPIQLETDSRWTKMFDEDESKDFTIVAEDGAEIKCHKVVMMVSSPVFKRMLSPENKMKEYLEGKMTMFGRSQEAVLNFIKFLYGKEISNMDCDLALELLLIGHAYEIEELWKKVSTILLKMGPDWFTKDVIVEMYSFVEKVDCLKELKNYLKNLMTKMDAE